MAKLGSVAFVLLAMTGACTLSTEGTPLGTSSSGGGTTGGAGTTTAATGTGTGASGSGGAGANGGGGGTAGSGGGSVEVCTNGADDDGNGLVDCDDPACSDHVCVDVLPGGGTYFVRKAGQACASGWTPLEVYDCAACACTAPCTLDVAIYDGNGVCLVAPLDTFKLVPNAECQDVDPDLMSASDGFGVLAMPEVASWLCEPDAKAMTIAGCTAPAGTCRGGAKACVPTAPTLAGACVLTDGDCAAPYSLERPVNEGSVDQCGCTCSGTIACTDANVKVYRDSSTCSGHNHAIAANGACAGTNDATIRSAKATLEKNPGICVPASLPPPPTKKLCCKPLP